MEEAGAGVSGGELEEQAGQYDVGPGQQDERAPMP